VIIGQAVLLLSTSLRRTLVRSARYSAVLEVLETSLTMKDKKLQVFVSSTFTDLREERQAAVEAILSSGHIPAGMELFAAGDESQMTVIERWIDESDVYLLILGGRYGSVDKKTGKSYTQLEYEYALSKKKPLFAVVINDKTLDQKIKEKGREVIEENYPNELKEFKSKVLNNLVRFWDDAKDIKIAIHETLSDFSYRKELNGWIKGDNSVNTGFLAEEIARLTKENSELRNRLNDFGTTSHALYGGLSYVEMEQLLKKEEFELNGEKTNLFQYMLDVAPSLSTNYTTSNSNRAVTNLRKYKLVDKTAGHGTSSSYRFSDDGHNFYLKALSMSK